MTVYTMIGHITNAILIFDPLQIRSNLSGGPQLLLSRTSWLTYPDGCLGCSQYNKSLWNFENSTFQLQYFRGVFTSGFELWVIVLQKGTMLTGTFEQISALPDCVSDRKLTSDPATLERIFRMIEFAKNRKSNQIACSELCLTLPIVGSPVINQTMASFWNLLFVTNTDVHEWHTVLTLLKVLHKEIQVIWFLSKDNTLSKKMIVSRTETREWIL